MPTYHFLAPEKKYQTYRQLKKTEKVDLLLKDDQKHFLKPEQRQILLNGVEKQYQAARKKAIIKAQPTITLAQAIAQLNEGKLTLAELTKGIKAKKIKAA